MDSHRTFDDCKELLQKITKYTTPNCIGNYNIKAKGVYYRIRIDEDELTLSYNNCGTPVTFKLYKFSTGSVWSEIEYFYGLTERKKEERNADYFYRLIVALVQHDKSIIKDLLNVPIEELNDDNITKLISLYLLNHFNDSDKEKFFGVMRTYKNGAKIHMLLIRYINKASNKLSCDLLILLKMYHFDYEFKEHEITLNDLWHHRTYNIKKLTKGYLKSCTDTFNKRLELIALYTNTTSKKILEIINE